MLYHFHSGEVPVWSWHGVGGEPDGSGKEQHSAALCQTQLLPLSLLLYYQHSLRTATVLPAHECHSAVRPHPWQQTQLMDGVVTCASFSTICHGIQAHNYITLLLNIDWLLVCLFFFCCCCCFFCKIYRRLFPIDMWVILIILSAELLMTGY